MPDVFSIEKRSLVMRAIRSHGNKDTEVVMAALLRKHKLSGWRRCTRLVGRPDFVFHHERVAVFVDGCFWHGCPAHGRKPGSNAEYWSAKLHRNKTRDRKVARLLRREGWKVLRIWEHALREDSRIAARLRRALGRSKPQLDLR